MSKTSNCGPIAGASREPDPIFAMIERHRATLRIWRVAYDRLGAREGHRKIFDEMPPDSTDAPEWIEAHTGLIEACEALDKALEAVLSTPPTTVAGVADLLDYVSRDEWEVAGAVEYSGGEWSGTILENALEGNHDQRLVENPAVDKSTGQLPAFDRRNAARTHSAIVMRDSTQAAP